LLPADTLIEEPYATLEPAVRTALIARGYRFENRGWNGDVQAIVLASGQEVAVSDPRGRGVARVLGPAP
jgi:gamma-glutamyltranspeptidase